MTWNGEYIIEIEGLWTKFGEFVVHRGVDLRVRTGEILALGDGVTGWQVGQRVVIPFMPTWLDGGFTQAHAGQALSGAVDGLLREQACLPASSLLPIPEHLSFEEASTLPCAAVTAWDALHERGQLQAGETVLILGSGGVSVFALQFAVQAGHPWIPS